MKTIALKFGGTSMADANQIRKVTAIIKQSQHRRYIVVSAPGKRSSDDIKVTDLLYQCYNAAVKGEDFEPSLLQIRERFEKIIRDLELEFDIDSEIETIRKHLQGDPEKDYMASRGEYLSAKVFACHLGYKFIDAADYIHFNENGSLNFQKTKEDLKKVLTVTFRAVLPGFYGSLPGGKIHTFSRGGSDVTGSIVARAVHADIYENWTDVSGMLAADPRIVENPRQIRIITYRELRELSYMGATVLHEDAVFPVQQANISINIRNTNEPDDPGTLIIPHLPENADPGSVTGIAGHKGFSSILIEKDLMNSEVGFTAKILNIIASHGLSFEHLPSGIDTMSLILHTDHLAPVRDQVLAEIQEAVQPDTLYVEDGIALIAVVGQGMAYYKGIAAKIFQAITDANVNIRMIDQGSSELNIIIGVAEEDYEAAIRSIYAEVIEKK